MPLELVNITDSALAADSLLADLTNSIQALFPDSDPAQATLYHNFPIYRDDFGALIQAPLALISDAHGVLLFAPTAATGTHASDTLVEVDDRLFQVHAGLFSRLLRTRTLQSSPRTLTFSMESYIYAPAADRAVKCELNSHVLHSQAEISEAVQSARMPKSLDPNQLLDIKSTLEGARGLLRSKSRTQRATKGKSDLARLFAQVETDISGFDLHQRNGQIIELDGPQRLRGLAGSGKTVVLAMKAALTHLRHPDRTILYTFHTRSLYQHVRNTIARFYRQFDDHDPDWDQIQILHGWGGSASPGVYYRACTHHGVEPLTFREALARRRDDPFDYACSQLLSASEISPQYDYVFIDEGQDFPVSFIRLCAKLAAQDRFILAFDELQNIFRTNVPTSTEIFGADDKGQPLNEFTQDIVLAKCYRNPREILVVAFALGFGIYGSIVQMLEDREHWEAVGFEVESGQFTEGASIEILRPKENSLTTVSEALPPAQIVRVDPCDSFDAEIANVAKEIASEVAGGIRPDDILVICIDDRNARDYLAQLTRKLSEHGISVNNIHSNAYFDDDFVVDNHVTLSTVHKAKGNEAFLVYVVGIDAMFRGSPTPKERNMIFTAMTRAKAIVRLSGIGEPAKRFKREVDQALGDFPRLRFNYPGQQALRQIRRDWSTQNRRKQMAQEKLEKLLAEFGEEAVQELLAQTKKSKRNQ